MLTDLFVRVFVCDLHSSCDRYFMHELDREDDEFTRDVLVSAVSACWELFDIHPSVEIRVKKILAAIRAQSVSDFSELRHGALVHLVSLFEFLLKNEEALADQCQQTLMTIYIKNFNDVFLQHIILSSLLRLLDKYVRSRPTSPLHSTHSFLLDSRLSLSLSLPS